jgi:hypothetical protein
LVYSNETHDDFPAELPVIAGPRKVIVKLMRHRLNFSMGVTAFPKGGLEDWAK